MGQTHRCFASLGKSQDVDCCGVFSHEPTWLFGDEPVPMIYAFCGAVCANQAWPLSDISADDAKQYPVWQGCRA